MAGTLALFAFVWSSITEALARRWSQLLWSLVPMVLAASTIAIGGASPELHLGASLLTVGVALRNGRTFRGPGRWAQGVGAVAWLTGMVCAHIVFG